MKKIILASSLLLLLGSITYGQYNIGWINLESSSRPYTMVTDTAGNLYTASLQPNGYYSSGVMRVSKYDVNGNRIWTYLSYDTVASICGICVNKQGKVFVAATGLVTPATELLILTLNNNGTYSGTYNYRHYFSTVNNVRGFAMDKNSNMFAAFSTNDSIVIMKFNSSLAWQWTKGIYGKIRESIFYFNNFIITQDNSGNVAVTGYRLAGGNNVILTAKISQAGVLLWTQTYTYNSNFNNAGSSIIADKYDNLFVAGIQYFNSDSCRIPLVKYNSSGLLVWSNVFNLPNWNYADLVTLTLDSSQNVYVNLKSNGDSACNIAKFSSNGILQWRYRIAAGSSSSNICIDNNGNIINFKGMGTDAIINNINSNTGTLNWSYSFNSHPYLSDIPILFTYSPQFGIHLATVRADSVVFANLRTNLVTHNICRSRNNLNKPINDVQFTYDTINISPQDIVPGYLITGVVVKIDTVLHPLENDLEFSLIHTIYTDTLIYRRGIGANFIGTFLSDTSANQICSSNASPFTGSFQPCKPLSPFNSLSAEGSWILKIYDRRSPNTGTLKAWSLCVTYSLPIGVQQISSGIPKSFSLQQNYPNPFNPETKIKFNIPVASDLRSDNVTLTIYDALGREVETLVNEDLKPGGYEVSWNASACPSGVYFYKLAAGEFVESKKMILVK